MFRVLGKALSYYHVLSLTESPCSFVLSQLPCLSQSSTIISVMCPITYPWPDSHYTAVPHELLVWPAAHRWIVSSHLDVGTLSLLVFALRVISAHDSLSLCVCLRKSAVQLINPVPTSSPTHQKCRANLVSRPITILEWPSPLTIAWLCYIQPIFFICVVHNIELLWNTDTNQSVSSSTCTLLANQVLSCLSNVVPTAKQSNLCQVIYSHKHVWQRHQNSLSKVLQWLKCRLVRMMVNDWLRLVNLICFSSPPRLPSTPNYERATCIIICPG